MSDIRFVEAQGDRLDAAIAEAAAAGPPSVRTRLRSRWRPPTRLRSRWRPPTRLRPRRRPRGRAANAAVAVALALVVAGCAVAATGLLGSSQRLAAGKVDCFYGTGLPGASDAISGTQLVSGATLVAGETPSAFCAREIRQTPASALRSYGFRPVRDPTLVTCQANATTAAVYIASGAADQCHKLGLKPLPNDFAAASASLRALSTQLHQRYVSRNCWSPNALVRVVRSTLEQSGFGNWRVIAPTRGTIPNDSPIGLARCAVVSSGDSFQSLDGVNRTVNLSLGLPRSVDALINRADAKLSPELWQHCYSRAGVRDLVERTFAPSGLSVKIAITTNPNAGPGFSWGTRAEARHYAADCPILEESWPTLDDRTMLVWLDARNGTYLRPYHGDPPLSDFHG